MIERAFAIWLNWAIVACLPIAIAVCIKGHRESR